MNGPRTELPNLHNVRDVDPKLAIIGRNRYLLLLGLMDTLSSEQRAERMRLVKSRNTKPEMAVRRLVHALGYRYRLHSSELPGTPDLVFSRKRKLIFVHGCFWHRCPHCRNGKRVPKSNVGFWQNKLEENRQRDQRHREELYRLGWEYLIIWECQVKDMDEVENIVKEFLEN